MRKLLLIALMLINSAFIYAQLSSSVAQDSTFSINKAIEFALSNNRDLKKSGLEKLKAEKKVWETTTIGLPQVSAKGAYSYMVTVPDALEQFSSIGDMFSPIYGIFYNNGSITEQEYNGIMSQLSGSSTSTSDLRTTATLDVTVSQLIFNGSYIVGLQASRTYRQLSDVLYQQKTSDVTESVTSAYAGVLIAIENQKVLSHMLSATQKNVSDLTELNKEGFVENTDVDQLKLTASTIKSGLENLQYQIGVAKQMLKLSMGYDLTKSIDLTDSLNGFVKNILQYQPQSGFDVIQNVTYQLLNTQEKLSELNLKNTKAEFLPTVAAFYNHQENFNDKSFNLTPPDIIGVNIQIPIFSSWGRVAKVKQQIYSFEQAKLDKLNALDGLTIQHQNTLNMFITARKNCIIIKEGLTLAYTIYNKTLIKYKEGVSTSFDLAQAQGQYLKAQTEYFKAVMTMVNSKTALDKLLTKYVNN